MSVSSVETVEQIRSLKWVEYIGRCDGPMARDDATHRIDCNLSELRTNWEIHTLENLGVEDIIFSATPDKGSRLYVTI